MHIYQLQRWKTSHDFEVDYRFGERRSQIVLLLTSVTMVVEIVAGNVFGSMALVVSIVTHYPKDKDPTYYKNLLSKLGGFSHITIEVNSCEGPSCIPIEDRAT